MKFATKPDMTHLNLDMLLHVATIPREIENLNFQFKFSGDIQQI